MNVAEIGIIRYIQLLFLYKFGTPDAAAAAVMPALVARLSGSIFAVQGARH
jgi:hypothetical protein